LEELADEPPPTSCAPPYAAGTHRLRAEGLGPLGHPTMRRVVYRRCVPVTTMSTSRLPHESRRAARATPGRWYWPRTARPSRRGIARSSPGNGKFSVPGVPQVSRLAISPRSDFTVGDRRLSQRSQITSHSASGGHVRMARNVATASLEVREILAERQRQRNTSREACPGLDPGD
jgi:hypothetical protein